MGRAIMVQGTASHVGKSILVAGLCRLLRQDGVRVAPFKAQNMALNSFATPDGREIGRAQAVQAVAAGIVPTVDMNPILLKPEGQARSQVVLAGRPIGVMDAMTYHRRKEELWPTVEASLQRLLADYDVVVIEGAGSPVEVNLKASDLVNMRVALAVNAPVLLVADIDRGGVFAALVGTMELLDPPERDLVAGFIVNKFRGDPRLFAPGVAFLQERLGRPVIGVVPWIEELGIAEEDSQGLQLPSRATAGESSVLDIVVVRLPHLANFDDFDLLAHRGGVRLRYCDRVEDLGHPDLVILPGTKTTRSDLQYLEDRGLAAAVVRYARVGGVVLGICGGYQMLGEHVADPDGQEGPPGIALGLGLLPVTTRFDAEKATWQVRARVEATSGPFAAALGQGVAAYEIHMGRTTGAGPAPFVVMSPDGSLRPDGAQSPDGRIVGTYLHGLLQSSALLEPFLQALARSAGKLLPAPIPEGGDPFDRLAAQLRVALDVPVLHGLLGIST